MKQLLRRKKNDSTESSNVTPEQKDIEEWKKKIWDSGYLNDGTDPNNPARVYVDGIFDLFHYGHARALRQAKLLFQHTHLIVGVCNDELTHRLKGKTVMTHAERAESLRHCRYVDEVVENAPWVVDKDFMIQHKIEFMAHGQDASFDENGKDVYEFVKSIGRFKTISRTEGVSTSELILRIIKEYDEYVSRNISRGFSRQEMNVGLLKEKQIIYKNKLKKLKEKVSEELEENHVVGFLKKFGGYFFEGESFPC